MKEFREKSLLAPFLFDLPAMVLLYLEFSFLLLDSMVAQIFIRAWFSTGSTQSAQFIKVLEDMSAL